MSLLWGLINTLQLLTFYYFINVQFPINVSIYLKSLYDLANMEVLPTDELRDYFGEEFDQFIDYEEDSKEEAFDANEYLTQTMIDADYGETRVMRSNILIYILFFAIMALALIAVLLRVCCWKL